MAKKRFFTFPLIILLIASVIGFYFYQKIFDDNVLKSGELFINSADDFKELTVKIAPFVIDLDNFVWVANRKKFTSIKAGRYIIKENMSNNDLVNMLRSGNQTAINLSFNNQDTLEKLAARISQQIEADSITLINSFLDDTFLRDNNLNPQNVLGIFIPNSYEVYWNVSAEKLRNKMLYEFKTFWNNERVAKAKKLNLTPNEVITLASIVQKETAQKSERPIVAGLYLNRLKNDWPLQADPTIIYCIRQLKGQDYVVKRVLTFDLEIISPYNTYKNLGLPPSLIAMPDVSAIEAVLNPEKHDYFYMCASIDNIGFHKFAKSLPQHNKNAEKYQNWLNKQGVNR
ncbi:MAG: endolytic transglycosylase MltG [Flavobacteriia bacterium]|nr:endolytic transglycosylase MltG [Flavobacteriia bacterium]OIP47303.1 MAG: aminodeoxychorismate lyase [Flavobacteriaceae bacterium CG2_30_31_66]PIV96116.1 MAG: endolytic transglycosylase MltG [Flavobacteriaceae bacterium CG17_big_fil_post_rev_8_21_14_2_50_31_13]PIY14333.1 MAG: endolytic transglycosylase MltG [Flavobacteriaceae bacterium CG_4_10_14_3_um_filter_31_253]PIZ10420.1 MAG: endolytic transglycosylase MltG [Flavobacteriaceae bacterium CG_4_10_14_0_8_um_filter_31_99]PJC11026.1 MAG: end